MGAAADEGQKGQAAVRLQVAALCHRPAGTAGIELLLLTSRDTGRWVLPKGWPIPGLSPSESAAREAWEEAGVLGRAGSAPLGHFHYLKRTGKGPDIPCRVDLYPLAVSGLAEDFPERAERRRAWFAPAEAAGLVEEAELAALLMRLARPGAAGSADAASATELDFLRQIFT